MAICGRRFTFSPICLVFSSGLLTFVPDYYYYKLN